MALKVEQYECGNLSKGDKIPEKDERAAKRAYNKGVGTVGEGTARWRYQVPGRSRRLSVARRRLSRTV